MRNGRSFFFKLVPRILSYPSLPSERGLERRGLWELWLFLLLSQKTKEKTQLKSFSEYIKRQVVMSYLSTETLENHTKWHILTCIRHFHRDPITHFVYPPNFTQPLFPISSGYHSRSKRNRRQRSCKIGGVGGGNKVYYGLGEHSEYSLYLAVPQVRVSITYSTQHGNINLKTTFVRYFLKIYIFNYLSLRNVHCLDKFHSSRKQTLTL